jgi:hypothetical protein
MVPPFWKTNRTKEIPNNKFQISNKSQDPNLKRRIFIRFGNGDFGHWDLFVVCDLGIVFFFLNPTAGKKNTSVSVA